MGDNANKISLWEIKIEGTAKRRLVDLHIEEKAGEHGFCFLNLLIEKALKMDELLSLGERKFKVMDSDGEIIFCGVPFRVAQVEEAGNFYLKVQLNTLSSQIDREARSRTFQSIDKTWKKVLEGVKEKAKKTMLQAENDGEKIQEMLYQDKQTDWEFLKRVAESHSRLIFVNSKSDANQIAIGYAPFKCKKDPQSFLEVECRHKLLTAEQVQKNTDSKAKPVYFTETTLATDSLGVGVGYSVKYANKDQIVTKSRIVTEGSDLINYITIVPKEGAKADAFEELKYAKKPKYLTGKVLEAKGKDDSGKENNTIKIHFDCDKNQSKKDARWIPYTNVVNNYMYSMPDEGDRVVVYFEEDGNLWAIGSLRPEKESEKNLQGTSPDKKSFLSSDHGMEFEKKTISLIAEKKASSSLLKAEDTEGISLTAKKDVLFKTDGNLNFQASTNQALTGQVTLVASHMTGNGMYLSTMGQPSSPAINPGGGMVGIMPSDIKSGGAKKEQLKLSEFAKTLDKKTNPKEQSQDNSSAGSGSGGKVKIKADKGLILKVGDSTIDVKGSTIKTRTLFTAGYIPGIGFGTGSPAKIEPGNAKNRSNSISVEHGSKDRARIKEGGKSANDRKRISRST